MTSSPLKALSRERIVYWEGAQFYGDPQDPPLSDPSAKTSPCELNHNLPILQAFTLNPAILLPIDITRHY